MTDNNEILFSRAKEGDVQAFEIFIVNYEKLIYNAAYRMLPNSYDAQDIAQEVMIKVYKNISKCKNIASFKSWLLKIVHNTCIDEIRKRKNKTAISLDKELQGDDGPMENQILKDENTPESELMKKDAARQIQKAIENLPQDYRTVIVLRDVNGLSYDEIAKITGVNLGTIKSRIARARSNLQKELKILLEQK